MGKPYVCYMTKYYDGSYEKAKKWAEDQNMDYEKIISEGDFWAYLQIGKLDDVPVYFFKGNYIGMH